jgi:DNA-binding transcriptional LysR family regulator
VELRHLRYFVAVAEELHFTHAAERLHMAQPPLSQQIRQLERELGVTLFERSRHGVRLTDAGVVLLDRARRTLEAADDAIWSTQRAALGEVGRLIVGFGGTAVPVLSDVIAAHHEKYPGVRVVLRELGSSAQIQHLLDRQIHVGLVREHATDDRIQMEVLRREPLVVVLPAAHRLATRKRIAMRELAAEPWVLAPRTQSSSYSEAVHEASAEAGFQPQVVQEASETIAILGLVAAGVGLTVLSEGVEALRPRGVVFRRLGPPGADLELAVAWRRDQESALVSAFVDTCRRVASLARKASAV